ncbi:hypothetical protein [Hyphomonas johnsonii]|uniref:Uncharacterized protein n=1 Tax=Hyphomonas johnsonii MHS-2 TaxID=1280950 RepID=A0A059FU73_9PROT|nr:hypothetical protein [Hyphomonas johnsonii]KCZ93998.1 hypothetical protein HJO_01445 [Hyphomonas johnsonii MHS-2]
MTEKDHPKDDNAAGTPPEAPPRPKARRVWLLWLLPLAALVVIAWYFLRGGLDRTHTFSEVTSVFAEHAVD